MGRGCVWLCDCGLPGQYSEVKGQLPMCPLNLAQPVKGPGAKEGASPGSWRCVTSMTRFQKQRGPTLQVDPSLHTAFCTWLCEEGMHHHQ
ncbi:hypothetical protein E2C01_005825 [Portunus trituberculatus]|uniref:Uncharacterized protein n=1 Tax=Portunus trituberculatus TaxID=210409 RepID=A0A5B7CVE6_PORTR|nr:hypothetical protein [Portunus trituberculatus]